MDRTAAEKWYDQNRGQYEDLMKVVETLLKTLLRAEDIPYHSVNGRLKDRTSCVEKCERKQYNRPEQIMDLAGLRIITHTIAEVEKVCRIIESEFDVDQENSANKAKDMGVDKVGYLSVHYVVRMRPDRLKLTEYSRFEGLCCEIQVRSLLQHAWAEIEHDRSYKFAGKLPEVIERKFHLVAGTLELMDQEFRTLSEEIDRYAEEVKVKAQKGNLEIPIDSTSLLQYLNEFFKEYDPESLAEHYQEKNYQVVEELRDMGVQTLRQLNDMLKNKSAHEWVIGGGSDYNNFLGILRDAMVLQDARKYFSEAWKGHWGGADVFSIEYWKKNGVDLDELADIIDVVPPDEYSEDYSILMKEADFE